MGLRTVAWPILHCKDGDTLLEQSQTGTYYASGKTAERSRYSNRAVIML